MADPRLDSVHLGALPRRHEYRRAREALLGARGWLTLAAEQLHGLAGGGDDGSALPPVRPGTKFLLVDHEAGCAYPLRTGLNTIGRLPNNDIVLDEPAVSRRHCVVLVHAWGRCELHDTASRNGTLVNGRRVQEPVALASGDSIQVCRRRLLFVSDRDYRAALDADDYPQTLPE